MTKQEILDEVRELTLWGMKPYRGSKEQELLLRMNQIRQLVEKEGAKLS